MFNLFDGQMLVSPRIHVVVAPRILLANQLCSEFLRYDHVMHVHSGETNHFSTTKPKIIKTWSDNVEGNQ